MRSAAWKCIFSGLMMTMWCTIIIFSCPSWNFKSISICHRHFVAQRLMNGFDDHQILFLAKFVTAIHLGLQFGRNKCHKIHAFDETQIMKQLKCFWSVINRHLNWPGTKCSFCFQNKKTESIIFVSVAHTFESIKLISTQLSWVELSLVCFVRKLESDRNEWCKVPKAKNDP